MHLTGYTPAHWRTVTLCSECKCVHPDIDRVCLLCGAETVLGTARPHRPQLRTRLLALLAGRGFLTSPWEVRR